MKKILTPLAAAIVLGIGNVAVPTQAEAGSPFKWMNPMEWFFGDDDDDDWYYDRYRRYGYGWGGPWGGWGGYPGYRPPIVIKSNKSNQVAAAPKIPD